MNSFNELAKDRYSCRKISDRKVEQEKIDKIIESAIAAPTAVNKQPFKIFLMDSEEAKKNIHEVCNYTFGADTFLLLGYTEKEGWVRSFDNRNFADVDGSIVATHMMMEIADQGLATTWVGHFDAPKLKSMYKELADYELIAIFPIGYPTDEARPSHLHAKRKSKEDVFEIL